MITALMLIALSGAPPSIDPGRICKNANASAVQQDGKAAIDSCVRDEQSARDKLNVRWTHYSASARAACRDDGGGVPLSYVELWTCLEMQPGGSLSLQNAANAGAPTTAAPSLGQKPGASAAGSAPAPGAATAPPSAGSPPSPGSPPASGAPPSPGMGAPSVAAPAVLPHAAPGGVAK